MSKRALVGGGLLAVTPSLLLLALHFQHVREYRDTMERIRCAMEERRYEDMRSVWFTVLLDGRYEARTDSLRRKIDSLRFVWRNECREVVGHSLPESDSILRPFGGF